MKYIRKFLGGLGIAGILLSVAAFVGLVIGWFMNIFKLIDMLGDPALTPMFIARIVGIPVGPLGGILGWF